MKAGPRRDTLHRDKLHKTFKKVSKRCFAAMQTETALAMTAPYHVEELSELDNLLSVHAASRNPYDHFIAIGCGNLRYMDVALRTCKTYTAVEPNICDQIPPARRAQLEKLSGVRILDRDFA